jgi:NAD(P)H-hydrate epimerase
VTRWVDAHRLEAASSCAERFGAVVVLKGAGTIVQISTGGPVVCDTGPPSLATAGTGDVLTGVVAAFLAKASIRSPPQPQPRPRTGLPPPSHRTGGLVASDVIAELPAALS